MTSILEIPPATQAEHLSCDVAIVGSGAGTWERYWNRDRPSAGTVRNVHNLYLEALATLGIIGALIFERFEYSACRHPTPDLRRDPLTAEPPTPTASTGRLTWSWN